MPLLILSSLIKLLVWSAKSQLGSLFLFLDISMFLNSTF